MTTIDALVEPRGGSASISSGDGWDLEGIPRRFWPKIRDIIQAATHQHHRQFSAHSVAVSSALVNALALQSIAQKAGSGGEALARAAGSFAADWEIELCPPYRKWPPKKKRFVAEEVVEILSEVIDTVPDGAFANQIRSLGASMQQKLAGTHQITG